MSFYKIKGWKFFDDHLFQPEIWSSIKIYIEKE